MKRLAVCRSDQKAGHTRLEVSLCLARALNHLITPAIGNAQASVGCLFGVPYIETVVLNWVPVMFKSFSRLFSRACAMALRST